MTDKIEEGTSVRYVPVYRIKNYCWRKTGIDWVIKNETDENMLYNCANNNHDVTIEKSNPKRNNDDVWVMCDTCNFGKFFSRGSKSNNLEEI